MKKSAQRRRKHCALAVVRRTHKYTQTHKQTHRQGRLQYTAQLSAQCTNSSSSSSSTVCSFQSVDVEETIFVGAPLFVGPALDSA